MEAPGVERRRDESGLATSQHVSAANERTSTASPTPAEEPKRVSQGLARVDCSTVVRALENALVALDEDRPMMARKRIRLALRELLAERDGR